MAKGIVGSCPQHGSFGCKNLNFLRTRTVCLMHVPITELIQSHNALGLKEEFTLSFQLGNKWTSNMVMWFLHNSTTTFEESLAVFHRTKHFLTMIAATCSLVPHPRELKTRLHKNPHMDVYSYVYGFIHNCTHLETTSRCSLYEWMNKLWYIQKML